MVPRRRRAVLLAAAVVLVLVLVVTFNSTVFPFIPGAKSKAPMHSTIVSSTNWLQLDLSVNSTTVPFGGSVLISADVRNTLPNAINITAASDWPLLGLNAASPNDICPQRDDLGLVIFPGSLTVQNMSGLYVAPLYHEIGASCPNGGGPLAYSYLFQPTSEMAEGACGCDPGAPSNDNRTTCGCNPCPSLSIKAAQTNVTFAVRGYLGDPNLHHFAPGPYTVAAGDEWGAMAITHFTVTNPGCDVLQVSLPLPTTESRQLGSLNTPGAWVFTTELGSTAVIRGQNFSISASLLNAALDNQTVEVVNPLLTGLQVLRSDGSVAWQYAPPSVTAQQSVASGGHVTGVVNIPSTQLQTGRTYTVVARPGLYSQDMGPLWSNLTISIPLLVC